MTDIAAHVDAFVETLEELAAILARELLRIQSLDIPAIGHEIEQKAYLAQAFERQMQRLVEQREALATLDEETRAALRQRSEAFAMLVAENMAAIGAAQRTTQRVVNVLVEAMRDAAAPAKGYNNLSPKGRTYVAPQRLSVSVNRAV